MEIKDSKLEFLVREKLSGNFELSDLLEITMLKIDFLFDYEELLMFNNLKELRFSSIEIEKELLEVLNKLPNLKKVYLINCDIDNLEFLDNKLDELYLERCSIKDISVLNRFTRLNSLSIVDFKNLDLNKISIIRNIENISFMDSTIINPSKLIYLNKVVNLCLSNTGIINIDYLIEIETLKKLVIDEEIFNSNIKVVQYLINRRVEVFNMYGESFGDING